MASFSLVTLRPEGYGHISAFLDIKLLLYYSLRDLGHEVSLATNRFPEGSTAIVFGAHLINDQFLIDLPRDCILFNTEQLGPNASPWSDQMIALAQRYLMWDYSSFNLQQMLASDRDVRALRFRLGHHSELERISVSTAESSEFIFYGSITPLREQILGRIKLSERLKISAYFGMYGWQRDGLLSRARAVLNLHSQPCRVLEWVRMLPLLANAIPCIALVHPESRSDDDQLSYVLTVSEQDPTAELEELYASVDQLQDHADAMQQRFREQESQVEFTQAALDATFQIGFVPATGPERQPAWCDSPARRAPDPLWYQHTYTWISDPRRISEFHLQEGWQRQYHPDEHFADEFQAPVWLGDDAPASASARSQRLAVVLHFHQEQEARLFFANFGRWLADQADFFITTSSAIVSAALQSLAQDYKIKSATILLTPNRGRDIPSKYIYFGEQLRGYDLCFFSHGKQSNHAWFHDHNSILAGSRQRIDAIRELFYTDASLGLVFPDYLLSLRPLIGWGSMRSLVDELLEPQGWDSRDVAMLEFPAGGFLWARPAALEPIFQLNLTVESLPEEPLSRDNTLLHAIERLPCLAAQHAGFHWIKLARSKQDSQPSTPASMLPPNGISQSAQRPSIAGPTPSLQSSGEAFTGLHVDAPEPAGAAPDFASLQARLRIAPTPISLLHFHHYDKSGYLPVSWRLLLRQAEASGYSLLITTCSGFDDESLRCIQSHQWLALRRPNLGACLGSLSYVALFAQELLAQGVGLERLLFLNDSILPARSSDECIQNLLQLAELCSQDRACLGGFTDSFERGYHLQSYALLANRQLLADVSWLLFWSAFDSALMDQELIDEGEISLSASLSSAGVNLVAMYPLLQCLMCRDGCTDELKPFANLDLMHLNPAIFLSQTLRDCGFGFIKKKRLFQRPMSLPLLHEIFADLDPETLQFFAKDLARLSSGYVA
ncbi:MAG: rhamnan synthesis F family protein [Synechococcaceae cyanobacterium]|jgi:hypothetical protein